MCFTVIDLTLSYVSQLLALHSAASYIFVINQMPNKVKLLITYFNYKLYHN